MLLLLALLVSHPCPSAGTLEELVVCLRARIPGSASNRFVAPTVAEQGEFRGIVREMLGGACEGRMAHVQVRAFVDRETRRTYCVATDGGARGWGTFIVDAAAIRELSHQAPHPLSDSATELQAVGVFKATRSRSFLMAGAHRNANTVASRCQARYEEADAAHNVDNFFHAANAELLAFYGNAPWTAIQWHGMAVDTCVDVDVYLSDGRKVRGELPTKLQQHLRQRQPAWKVEVPGGDVCKLNATDNTQGRLLNGVDASAVCGTTATTATGRFLHIEQDPAFRSARDWVGAIEDTWPLPRR